MKLEWTRKLSKTGGYTYQWSSPFTEVIVRRDYDTRDDKWWFFTVNGLHRTFVSQPEYPSARAARAAAEVWLARGANSNQLETHGGAD